jgi:pimeloyl-ACP methyl ester carboxylesterase
MEGVRALFRTLVVLALAAGAVAGPGCGTVYIRRSNGGGIYDAWRASALTCGDLSPRTWQTLRQFDLAETYRRKPAEAVARLHVEAVHTPQPDLLFALAEVSYLRGREAEEQQDAEAIGCYYRCAGYAYHFLFDPRPRGEAALSSFDPRHRLACDLYNSSVAKCLAAAQRVGQLDPRGSLRIPTSGGHDHTLPISHVGFAWKPEEFGHLLFSANYEVVGLVNHYRTYGLGVPLIARRAPSAPKPAHAFYPATVSFPVTAFLRFEGSLADLGEAGSPGAGRLELYNPLDVQSVAVGGRHVPLETDLTTPLAYFLAHARVDNSTGYKAFLNPDVLGRKAGLHTLEPYQPGKIPVVFVHGLFGSPLTWAPVYNDLLADPALRKRYQFWAYFYPTGNPYLAAAADLRRDLARLRHELDPTHHDRVLDEMVVVGHSMGGLVSKLVTVPGGDDFWQLVSHAPLTTLKLTPDTRGELQAIFYFEPVSSVKRVIFTGTPHRGSKLSPSFVGRIGARLAGLPLDVMRTLHEVAEGNPQLYAAEQGQTIPTSVDLLDPSSPALELLAARPKPRGMRWHSIIGVTPSALPLERWLSGGNLVPSDGVVPYASAHLDDADSEVVVPADHYTVHHHPLAIREMKRILAEHVKEVEGRLHAPPGSEIVPVRGQE